MRCRQAGGGRRAAQPGLQLLHRAAPCPPACKAGPSPASSAHRRRLSVGGGAEWCTSMHSASTSHSSARPCTNCVTPSVNAASSHSAGWGWGGDGRAQHEMQRCPSARLQAPPVGRHAGRHASSAHHPPVYSSARSSRSGPHAGAGGSRAGGSSVCGSAWGKAAGEQVRRGRRLARPATCRPSSSAHAWAAGRGCGCSRGGRRGRARGLRARGARRSRSRSCRSGRRSNLQLRSGWGGESGGGWQRRLSAAVKPCTHPASHSP